MTDNIILSLFFRGKYFKMNKVALITLLTIALISCKPDEGDDHPIQMPDIQEDDSVFHQENKVYTEFDDGISLNKKAVWGNFNTRFYVPIGFSFRYMESQFDSVGIETSGRLVFDDNHFYFADALSEISMQDRGIGSGASESPIDYKLENTSNGKVLVIQFRNAGFAQDANSFVNFQIRLYEKTGEIELHLGPHVVNDWSKTFTNGPYCGVYKVSNFNPLTYDYRLALDGHPDRLSVTIDSGIGLNPFQYKLLALPKEGTRYRFRTN